ncbi:MAG: glycine cleavage T C-terminal barrel domain-containing protein, partial [Candidatus Hydrogenedentota bacterium]
MSASVESQVHSCRTGVALWLRNDYTFVRFAGPDTASWLHSQTTNDVDALESGGGHSDAILDRQGRLQGHFTLHRWDDEYWMLIEKSQVDHTLQHLDDHKFIEEVEVEPSGDALEQLVIQGPKILPLLSHVMDSKDALGTELLPAEWYGVHPIEIFGYEVLAFRLSMTGEDGFVLVGEQGECSSILGRLLEQEVDYPCVRLDPQAQTILRIESGIPKFGVDMDTSHLIPETTLERNSISYEKGCYLGQEVVARLKAYGTVKRALMGLQFSDGAPDALDRLAGAAISVEGKRVGHITSAALSPTLDTTIALAYLNRDHRTPDAILDAQIDGLDASVKLQVCVLPLHTASTREEQAQALYTEALDLFQADLDDSDESAIPLLKEALLLSPEFEDAYEVLGVILNRHHRVDEAIYFMKHLKELNPNSIMAHTNLSVFYLA